MSLTDKIIPMERFAGKYISLGSLLNKISIIFIIQYLISGFLYSQSQELEFEHITTEQGLSSNTVYDIIQDHLGFMWFATRDGLNRYDGCNIKVFKYSPLDTNSIAVNWCQSLHKDKFGKLWVGTLYGGLNLYDHSTEKFIAFKHDPKNPHSISNDVVLGICEDDSANLWLGTWDGLNKLVRNNIKSPDPNFTQFIRYKNDPNNPNSLSDNRIWELYRDKAGIIWIGTEAGGLNRFDPKTKTFKHYKYDRNNPNSISHNNVRCIYEDPAQKKRFFWIGTHGGGLNKFDVNNRIFFHDNYKPTGSSEWGPQHIMSALRDKNGELWIGTWAGLKKHIPKNNEEFPQTFLWYQNDITNPNSLRSNEIKKLYQDQTGILWIGTINGGVNRITSQRKNFNSYAKKSPIFKNVPNNISIYEDESGVWWLGTGMGVYKVDRDKQLIERYHHDPKNLNSLSGYEIYSIYEQPDCVDKTLWILCRDGGLDKLVLKKDPNSGLEKAIIHHVLPIPSDSVSLACKFGLSLVRDRKGMFWIGANEGLFQFDQASGRVAQYQADPQDPHSLIRDRVDKIYQSPFDSGNVLWLGTANGLYRIDPDHHDLVHYTPDPTANNSINDFRIISLLADGPTYGKILWIGTWSGGLNKLNIEEGTFRHFMEKDGLPSNTVYSILQDEKGFLWLGTKNGLAKFDPQTETCNTYDRDDGLHFTDFYLGGAFKNPKSGEMLFGGDGACVLAFFPDSIKDDTNIPPIVITDFKVFNKPINLEKSIFTIDELKLSYKQNFFSFEFAALSYTFPSKNQYAYLLEGIDKDWIYSGNRHYASYTNVPPGDYIFRVKGSNYDGIWNEQGTAVKIIITPPYWQTAWFRVLVGLIILGIFALIFYIRVSMLKKERNTQQAFSRRLIEEVEKGRKRIARELHDGLGQNLLIIKNELHQAILSRAPQKQTTDDLDNISTKVSDSIHEVREISTDLHPHQLDRLGLTDAIESVIEKFSETFFGIKFVSELAKIDNLFPKDLEIHIFRIIQEGLNNIVKHANCNRAIVQIKKTDKAVNILIKDNGCGFDFKSYAIDRIGHQGFGLSGIAERVKILKGKLAIDSEPGRGTVIQIFVSINKNIGYKGIGYRGIEV